MEMESGNLLEMTGDNFHKMVGGNSNFDGPLNYQTSYLPSAAKPQVPLFHQNDHENPFRDGKWSDIDGALSGDSLGGQQELQLEENCYLR